MAKKITFIVLVVLWMCLIFAFSAQPAVESDELSIGIAEKIVSFLQRFTYLPTFAWIDIDVLQLFIQRANFFVRKFAHFGIFAVLGVWVYNLFAAYDVKRKRVVWLTLLVCLLYAMGDEIHQIYVPGRAGQIRDVFIDFSGSLCATILIYLVFGRRADKKTRESDA